MKRDNILVSVEMITYMHEHFIRQAIEGVLMQETNFEFELIIADDCSPDNTEAVVRDVINKHPKGHAIKYFRHENNIGMHLNAGFALSNCNGKYIAICEGDDYWTDPLKLQKQADFLEKNPDFSMVCTNYTSDEIGEYTAAEQEVSLFDVLRYSAIGTVTTMFTREISVKYLKENVNLDLSMGDFQFWLFICKHSKAYRLADTTAYYRILQNSATGRNSILKQIKFATDVLFVVHKYIGLITIKSQRESILRERYGHLFKYLVEGNDRRFLKFQVDYFKTVKTCSLLDFKILLHGIRKIYL